MGIRLIGIALSPIVSFTLVIFASSIGLEILDHASPHAILGREKQVIIVLGHASSQLLVVDCIVLAASSVEIHLHIIEALFELVDSEDSGTI
jgi:hypothetical protein